jgi:hypothetical protein
MRIERVVLEHHRDVAVCRLDFVHHAVADLNRAARDGLKPGHHAEKRGLAAARGADQHAERAVLDVQGHAFYGFHIPRIDLPHRIERHACHLFIPSLRPVRS